MSAASDKPSTSCFTGLIGEQLQAVELVENDRVRLTFGNGSYISLPVIRRDGYTWVGVDFNYSLSPTSSRSH